MIKELKDNKLIQLCVCLVIATVLSLTTHIYIMKWTDPILGPMMQGIPPDPSDYTFTIIFAAYATAFIPVGFVVFLYYHTQHLLAYKSNLIKTLLVACIIFGVKGDLVRMPIMNFLVSYTFGTTTNPLLYVTLSHLDGWLANLFLAVSLVYLCPQKNKMTL